MKIIIIGGSAAGMGAAAKLKRNTPDAEVVVYQKSSYVSLGACGLPYVIDGKVENEKDLLSRSIAEFEKSGIQVFTNIEITKVDFDNKIVYANGVKDKYDKLIIATGARPIVPSIPGVDGEGVYSLTTLEDGVEVRDKIAKNNSIKSVAIIGGGFIGVETSVSLINMNKKVNLIEMQDTLLSKSFDQDMIHHIEDELKINGVQVYTSTQVSEILLNDKKVCGVKFSNGKSIEVEAVILSIGFQPNTSFLKETKIKLMDNGAILVNTKCETNIKDVYSGGDCSSSKNYITGKDIYSPLATVASKMAKVIADNISNKNINYVGSIQSAMIKLFSKESARTGLTELQAKAEGIDYQTVLINDKNYPSYLKGQTDISLKLIMNKKSRELIGAQIIGSDNSILRINGIVSLIWAKTKVDSALEQIDMPYAPPFSRTQDILHIALSKLNK
ncbi:NADH oxidase [Spiroplasma sp. TIUS-1]|uniref:CoA-disulfide reductase n=1 Tax=Spiroplasma sp. TIUS-1 TaxID=216963 RepID=UPI001398CA88|nr:CoA-disulfide reductase [Spiroplasma sp. TIUS-1]QHX35675.1 NADH oxidase [Spiroplasma sp. TIUS-1]